MTLLITVFAAVIASIFWYNSKVDRKLGTLALMYWGASLMWLVDAVVEYIELGAEFFEQAPKDMINDAYWISHLTSEIKKTLWLSGSRPPGNWRSLFQAA